jgi:hypothetical protein
MEQSPGLPTTKKMTAVRAYDDRRITAHSRHNILSRHRKGDCKGVVDADVAL